MMYITSKGKEHQWHVGEPFNAPFDSVMTFQADGDELVLILNALMGNNNKRKIATLEVQVAQYRLVLQKLQNIIENVPK